ATCRAPDWQSWGSCCTLLRTGKLRLDLVSGAEIIRRPLQSEPAPLVDAGLYGFQTDWPDNQNNDAPGPGGITGSIRLPAFWRQSPDRPEQESAAIDNTGPKAGPKSRGKAAPCGALLVALDGNEDVSVARSCADRGFVRLADGNCLPCFAAFAWHGSQWPDVICAG